MKSQLMAIKTTSSKPSRWKKSIKDNRENRSCFHCGKVGHLKKNCQTLKSDKNKSVVSDGMGSSSVEDTKGSVFSAVRVNSMRLADKWICDSGASHNMTANKHYFAMYKRFSAPINISLTDEGTILTCGSGRVNVEILVEGKWCPDTWKTCGLSPILEDTCSRYRVWQNTELVSS